MSTSRLQCWGSPLPSEGRKSEVAAWPLPSRVPSQARRSNQSSHITHAILRAHMWAKWLHPPSHLE